jgi:transcriptional regulator with XRE-family HTH domain
MNPQENNFPEGLKKARLAKGLSQEKLGELINVSKQTISKYEKGTIEPTIGVASKLAKILDVTVDELIGFKPFRLGNSELLKQLEKILKLPVEFEQFSNNITAFTNVLQRFIETESQKEHNLNDDSK